jgi:hypothetical protein
MSLVTDEQILTEIMEKKIKNINNMFDIIDDIQKDLHNDYCAENLSINTSDCLNTLSLWVGKLYKSPPTSIFLKSEKNTTNKQIVSKIYPIISIIMELKFKNSDNLVVFELTNIPDLSSLSKNLYIDKDNILELFKNKKIKIVYQNLLDIKYLNDERYVEGYKEKTDFGNIEIIYINRNTGEIHYNKNFLLSSINECIVINKSINLFPFPHYKETYLNNKQHEKYILFNKIINNIKNYNAHLLLISKLKEINNKIIRSLKIKIICKLLPFCNKSNFSFDTNVKLFDNAKWECKNIFNQPQKISELVTTFYNQID